MTADLSTTNVLLAIMAAVSVIEGLVVVGVFAGGYLLFRRVSRAISEIEGRHVAPVSARVGSILDDVKEITTLVKAVVLRAGHAWK